MSKAKTPEELRDEFMHTIANHAHYWATQPDMTPLERCNGLVHSILVMIDGCSDGVPALDLIARPYPDDKDFLRAEGSDWIEDGTAINGDVMLHEMWRRYERKP